MAIKPIPLTFAAEQSKTFVFAKPVADYIKTEGLSLTIADNVVRWFSVDVDNGDGTMTGTYNASAAITGVASILIIDTP